MYANQKTADQNRLDFLIARLEAIHATAIAMRRGARVIPFPVPYSKPPRIGRIR